MTSETKFCELKAMMLIILFEYSGLSNSSSY